MVRLTDRPDMTLDVYRGRKTTKKINQCQSKVVCLMGNHSVSLRYVQTIGKAITVQILCIGTDRSQQTVQTKIRLLLKKQSDQSLRCLPFHQHLLDALMQCYIKLFYF